jgi:hypothetical protein
MKKRLFREDKESRAKLVTLAARPRKTFKKDYYNEYISFGGATRRHEKWLRHLVATKNYQKSQY